MNKLKENLDEKEKENNNKIPQIDLNDKIDNLNEIKNIKEARYMQQK